MAPMSSTVHGRPAVVPSPACSLAPSDLLRLGLPAGA
jgi:hypothetical protein